MSFEAELREFCETMLDTGCVLDQIDTMRGINFSTLPRPIRWTGGHLGGPLVFETDKMRWTITVTMESKR